MTPRLIRKYCIVDSASKALLENALTRLGLSARAYDRILKVSRTLADYGTQGQDRIGPRQRSNQKRHLGPQLLGLTYGLVRSLNLARLPSSRGLPCNSGCAPRILSRATPLQFLLMSTKAFLLEVNLRRELDHPRKVLLRLRQLSECGAAKARVRSRANRRISNIERFAAEL